MINRIKFLFFLVIIFAHSANLELIDITEDNWRLMLDGEWMIEFFAPWCPACKSLAPIWKRFASVAHNSGFNVAQIDVTKSPSLSGRFLVTALPTIYHVKNGEFRQYRGSRDGDAFMFFIKHKEWMNIDPIPTWKNPNSIHMSILSYFFKLSHLLKDFNTNLQDQYGLPTWGSYALLATATIFVGAALGLMLVCVVDFLYPAKRTPRQSFSLTETPMDANVDDELLDDVPIEDDDDDDSVCSESVSDARENSASESEKEKTDLPEDTNELKSSPSGVRKRTAVLEN